MTLPKGIQCRPRPASRALQGKKRKTVSRCGAYLSFMQADFKVGVNLFNFAADRRSAVNEPREIEAVQSAAHHGQRSAAERRHAAASSKKRGSTVRRVADSHVQGQAFGVRPLARTRRRRRRTRGNGFDPARTCAAASSITGLAARLERNPLY